METQIKNDLNAEEIVDMFEFHHTYDAIQSAISSVNHTLHIIKKFRATTRTLNEYRRLTEILHQLHKKKEKYDEL